MRHGSPPTSPPHSPGTHRHSPSVKGKYVPHHHASMSPGAKSLWHPAQPQGQHLSLASPNVRPNDVQTSSPLPPRATRSPSEDGELVENSAGTASLHFPQEPSAGSQSSVLLRPKPTSSQSVASSSTRTPSIRSGVGESTSPVLRSRRPPSIDVVSSIVVTCAFHTS